MESVTNSKRQRVDDPLQHATNTEEMYEYDLPTVNKDLDIDSKIAALKGSSAVVSLLSRTGVDDNAMLYSYLWLLFVIVIKKINISNSGGKKLCKCSGTVVECERKEESDSGSTSVEFVSTILTSATLLRFPSFYGDNCLAPDITVEVYLSKGKPLKGQVSGYDFHYNLAIVNITSEEPLSIAILTDIHDSMPLIRTPLLNDSKPFGLRPHAVDSNLFKLCHGDKIIALARNQRCLLVESGTFSNYGSGLDCQELFYTTCRTTKFYIGGPLINCDGEVIGIIFNYEDYAAFLPINIASRCLQLLKRNRGVRHPWFGIDLTNFYVAEASILEEIIQKLPHISNGIIVENVKKGSPAEYAGIVPKDIILLCGGEVVSCSLEFFKMTWDKASQSMEVVVMRPSTGKSLKLTIIADELNPNTYNRWPVPIDSDVLEFCGGPLKVAMLRTMI